MAIVDKEVVSTKAIWHPGPEVVEIPCGIIQIFSPFAAGMLEESSCGAGRAATLKHFAFVLLEGSFFGPLVSEK